jgi:hypothetical protein
MALSSRAWALQALGRFEAASTDLEGALTAVEDLRVHTVPDDFLSADSVSGISGCSPRAFLFSRRRGVHGRRLKLRSARGRARSSISWRAGSARGSRLTIVPHGPLFGLPFAALRDASDRYLIESYDVHYVPAVGALSYMSRESHSARSSSALLVGDPSPDAVRDHVMALPALPWAGREVETIARLLSPRATVLTGPDATEARVRESLAGKSLLHFATHGIVQNEERLSSRQVLRKVRVPGPHECHRPDARREMFHELALCL